MKGASSNSSSPLGGRSRPVLRAPERDLDQNRTRYDLGELIVSRNLTVTASADRSHAATLRQTRHALPAASGEPEPVRADIPQPQHPAWCADDFDATETGELMEHGSRHEFVELSLPNQWNANYDNNEDAERIRAEWPDRYAARGLVMEPYRPAWLTYVRQPHGGQPEIWLGRDETNRGASMTPDEAEQLARRLLALAEAARKDAGR